VKKNLRSGYWQDLTTEDFADVDPSGVIAVLPVAAVEQHGPHLPLATDALVNDAIVRATLERLGLAPTVLVLPAMTIGSSIEHRDYAGTLDISAETLLAAWSDVGRSVARAGVRKLVVLNAHGGQRQLLDLLALRLRAELAMLVVRASYFAFGAPPGLFEQEELAHGLHGGEIETSLMLHIDPTLVRRAALADFQGLPTRLAARGGLLGAEKPIGFGWLSQDLHPAGVCGNAARADPERGRAYLAYIAEQFARLLTEVGATPLDILQPPPTRSR
jgi:creatinine amidohydrolase